MPIANSSVETYSDDNIFAGNAPPPANDDGVLVLGQNLARGAVVGRIAATAKLTHCDNGAADGSEVPIGIMVHAIDASVADQQCQIYVAGCFHKDELVWHASFDTEPEKDAAFDGAPIVLR